MPMYLEDFKVGQTYTSPARTITEADIVSFAALSGDWNQIHTDVEFAKSTPFGQRIAHGMLVLSVSTGLGARMGFIEGTAIAFLSLTWKFSKPVFIGDTVRLQVKMNKKRAVGPQMGLVIFDAAIVNQREEIVQQGEWSVMVKRQGVDK